MIGISINWQSPSADDESETDVLRMKMTPSFELDHSKIRFIDLLTSILVKLHACNIKRNDYDLK